MPKRKSQSSVEEPLESEFAAPQPEAYEKSGPRVWGRTPWWLRGAGAGLVLIILIVGSFELVYAGKVLPGVTADGADVAGLTRTATAQRVADRTKEFAGHVLTITADGTNLRIPVASLGPSYHADRAAEQAYTYGRQGSLGRRIHEQLRSLLGRPTRFTSYHVDVDRLVPYVLQVGEDVLTPALDAGFSFNGRQPQVTPAQAGTRLDYGSLTQQISDRLSQTSTEPIAAPIYQLSPQLSTSALQAATDQLGSYLEGPIKLEYTNNDVTIDQKTIISWLEIGTRQPRSFLLTYDLADLYPAPATANIGLNRTTVEKYVTELAADIDQTPQNAGLSMQDGVLSVTQPSRTGVKLDQARTTNDILAALKHPADDRRVSLKLETTQADVNESNLESLGIKELISEGETYFPGSPSTRLTNVRAGARRFNGVVLKPGEAFSFGKLLGAVGPETGYVPELVILEGHEEKQYGGGLCQVSSTAFRAALAAGLPITERVNHSFAISYYTWPYSAPGVDATIYYPSVDFKFVNDTGHYILMQTIMNGVDLKFQFFGTKTKSGTIRGPEFITGTSDATKPSRTVFYRDVLDLAGNVTKTDTFYTNYKSSKDFPITKQFN